MRIESTNAMSAARQAQVAQTLEGRIRATRTPIQSFGSVVKATGARGLASKAPSSISYTLTNGTGGLLTYVMGDPKGLVAAAFGVTWTQPSASRGTTVAAVQGSYDSNPVSVRGMNITVSAQSQWSNLFRYNYGDVNGMLGGYPINFDEYTRPTNYISTELVLDFGDDPFVLDLNNCFTMAISGGQSATVTLMLGDVLR